jgi:hypothetical protein
MERPVHFECLWMSLISLMTHSRSMLPQQVEWPRRESWENQQEGHHLSIQMTKGLLPILSQGMIVEIMGRAQVRSQYSIQLYGQRWNAAAGA